MKTHYRTPPSHLRHSGSGGPPPQHPATRDARRHRPRHFDRFAQVADDRSTRRDIDEEGEDEDEALERE